jgi:uncharacterized protein YuzE
VLVLNLACLEATRSAHIEFRACEVAETKDLDENTFADLDDNEQICAITIEHGANAPRYQIFLRANYAIETTTGPLSPHNSGDSAQSTQILNARSKALSKSINRPPTGFKFSSIRSIHESSTSTIVPFSAGHATPHPPRVIDPFQVLRKVVTSVHELSCGN